MTDATIRDISNKMENEIVELTKYLKRYPFIGMLLRTYVSNTSQTDIAVFQKTLKTFNTVMMNDQIMYTHNDVENAFNIFHQLSPDCKKHYAALYKIILNGIIY